MPQILCPTCKSPLSTKKNYVQCPWCGQSLAGVVPHQAQGKQFEVSAWPKPHEWACAVILVMLACGLVIEGYRLSEPVVVDRKDELVATALTSCRNRIATWPKYDYVTMPPPAKNYGTPPDFYFVWPKGIFQVTNDEGERVPASATCRGHLDSGLITELSLNGAESR